MALVLVDYWKEAKKERIYINSVALSFISHQSLVIRRSCSTLNHFRHTKRTHLCHNDDLQDLFDCDMLRHRPASLVAGHISANGGEIRSKRT